MIIVSQNMTNYDVELPKDTILRINLAWINDLETLKNTLSAVMFEDIEDQLKAAAEQIVHLRRYL